MVSRPADQTTPEGLRAVRREPGAGDEVALEATGNTQAIARLLERHVGGWWSPTRPRPGRSPRPRSRPTRSTRQVLAQLLAADYLPAVWLPDDRRTRCAARSLRRAHIVRQRTRLKNQVHAILHRNLIPRCPAADLFGHKGRGWLAEQELPPTSTRRSRRCCASSTSTAEELRLIDAELGQVALERARGARLMTIPGVDATVALSIVAAVGDFHRFSTPHKLVSYLGLNPRVRQSGGQPAQPRADHQAGPRARPRDAGRGGLGGVQDAGPAAGVLRARRGPGAGCRSRWSRPPASSPCCAGTWSSARRTTPSPGPR